MSNRAETLTFRPARPEEHDELESIQLRTLLELREYREQLIADPGAIHLPYANRQ